MGSERDVIYSYAERDLRRKFPSVDGWQIQRETRSQGYSPDYVISRKWRGLSQYVLASVMLKSRFQQSDVDALAAPFSPENSCGSFSGKMVLVPSGADSSLIPEDIDIMEMRGFSCDGGAVVWSKRTLPLEANEE
jgi:hypothetical protein